MEGMSSNEYVKYLKKHGIRIGDNVHFRNPAHTSIDLTRPCLIEIGNNVDINENFTVLTHDFGTFVFRGLYKDFVNSSGKVRIGNNTVFGCNVTILKGVTIGDNCIIGAGSIVSRSIPSNSVAVGVPAKIVCTIDDYYRKRKEKQVEEAIQYGKEFFYAHGRDISIEELTEEWCLFLTKEDYNFNPRVKSNVDFRLQGYVDVEDFIKRDKVFSDYSHFLNELHKQLEKENKS